MSCCSFCKSKNIETLVEFGQMALAGGFLREQSFSSEKKISNDFNLLQRLFHGSDS